jgi:hypothetical protein
VSIAERRIADAEETTCTLAVARHARRSSGLPWLPTIST